MAQTFLRQPGPTLIDTAFLSWKAYVRLRATADRKLIKLAGPSLASVAATAEVTHAGLPYDVPQAWFKALCAHPVKAHGIAFHARRDDEALSYVLFAPSEGTLTQAERIIDLDEDWFCRLAERYRVGFAPG